MGNGDWKLVPRREAAPNGVRLKKRAAVASNQSRTAAPSGAQAFCVYEWMRKERPMAKHFSGIGGTQECAVAVAMSGSGGPAGPPPEPFFHRNFERQVKALATPAVTKDWETLQKAGTGAPVVAVLDASPHGVTKPDVSGHGFAMSRVIGHLSCVGGADAPDCAKFVRPYVALPLIYKDGGWQTGPDGGYLGYFHDLFDAFEAALADRPDDGHLIINLSLGWDPTTTDPNGPEVRHMQTLLERAYCDGVLVIAAAGNGPATAPGAVYPAALESTTKLPDEDWCKRLGIANPKLPASAARSYGPLIHAVGSVDLYDERLPTMRPWAHPRIATYGMAVTVPGPKAGEFFPPRSGTSVSTAEASALAADVWRIKPELDAAQVMTALYEGGHLLETKNHQSRTEVCLDTASDRCRKWPARRPTLCGAVNAALGAKKLACVTPAHPDPDHPATAHDHFPPPPSKPPTPPVLDAPCDSTNCGVPIGVSPAQGGPLVGPMGVATCGGCVLRKNRGNGWLEGSLDFNSTPDGLRTTVIIYTLTLTGGLVRHDYAPFASDQPVGPFNQGLPAGATLGAIGAEINWEYGAGSYWWTDGAPLQLSP